jgi:hypothetical protein
VELVKAKDPSSALNATVQGSIIEVSPPPKNAAIAAAQESYIVNLVTAVAENELMCVFVSGISLVRAFVTDLLLLTTAN